ncbi:MAG TPA: zinc-binding alcohol dehydrogenase, partial [Enteractinococcus helveticum]
SSWREVPTPNVDASHPLRIRTTATAISKGTETLVHNGQVPARIAEHMRAPAQIGDFSYPVSYGYLAVGVIDQGPDQWLGQRVFGLLPHHSHHLVTPDDVLPIPDDLSDHRALLTGAAETGINVLWQYPPRFGDRVTIIGAGMIGATTALLAHRMPLERLEVVDVNPARRQLVTDWGITAVTPQEAATDCDIVIHASGHQAGLARALEIAGDDGVIIEASWYGDNAPAVPLGADFHARRLSIIASQVGQVPPGHRHRRTTAQRQATGLAALRDDRFDDLITGVSHWTQLPQIMDQATTPGHFADATLCHVFEYP